MRFRAQFWHRCVSFTGFLDDMLGLVSDDLVLVGSFLLLFGLVIRFGRLWGGDLFKADAAVYDGICQILGHGFGVTVRRVILPLLQKSIIAGGLLVFVDVMKNCR